MTPWLFKQWKSHKSGTNQVFEVLTLTSGLLSNGSQDGAAILGDVPNANPCGMRSHASLTKGNAEEIIKALMKSAAKKSKPDVSATQFLCDTYEGKLRQRVEMDGEDGAEPFVVEIRTIAWDDEHNERTVRTERIGSPRRGCPAPGCVLSARVSTWLGSST